jgi:hypothetical protein
MQSANSQRPRRWNLTRVNLWFDLAIFVAALFAPALFLTGLTVHEWLGIGLGVAIIVHLLLHWQWLAQVTRRFFHRIPGAARLNYLVNALFFVDMAIIIFTGIMISRQALPAFGIQLPRSTLWEPLHILAADFMVFILALHVALHWKWLLNTANRYMLQPALHPLRRLTGHSESPRLHEEGVA